MGNLKKVLIIDDDLSIRFVLKKILSQQLSNIDIFTSEDGVQGIGYAFILKPDLIVIDSTLPKYSGRELVDFLSTNAGFKDTPIILLHEDDTFVENLPGNFIQISKQDELFPENLVNDVINEIGNIDDVPEVKRSFGIVNFLSRKIIGYSNSSFINAKKAGKGSVFRKVFGSFGFLFNQILSGFYLSLFYLIVGRKEKEVNLEQKEKDSKAYRSVIYPKVGFSVAISLFLGIHLFITLGGILTFGFLGTKIVNAASYTWDGGGTDGTCGGGVGDGNKWSCALNWSSDVVPTSLDTVTFNGTSTKDAVVDAGFGGTITSITIAAGYTGTITQARALIVSSTFTTSDGTFTAANQSLSVGGTFTMNTGSIFTASSATTYISSNFTINGGTFNHNGGTIEFDGSSVGTLICNNSTFNLIVFSHTAATKTVTSNCSLPLGNNPSIPRAVTLTGNLSGTGTLTTSGAAVFSLNSGGTFTGFSGYNFGSITISGANADFSSATLVVAATISMSSGTLTLPNNADLNGALTVSGGTINAPSGNMFLAGSLTISGTTTFNHNGGTLTLDGSTATLSCNNVTFNLVVDAHTSGAKTYNSNCTIPMGNNPNLNNTVLNGTISGTGNLVMNSNLQLNSGAVLSGFTGINGIAGVLTIAGATLDASTYSTFTLPAFAISSGTFTAPASMNVLGSFTISGGTFNHNNGTIIFSSGNTGVISCNNATIFNVQFTGGAGINKTVSSNCSLPLGSNPVVTNALIVAGTLTGSGTLNLNSNGNIFNAGATFTGFSAMVSNAFTVAGATLDFSAFTSFQQNNTVTVNSGSLSLPNNTSITNATALTGGTLTLNGSADLNGNLTISGGTFNASSGISYVGAGLTISGSPIFNHNNGTISFDGGTSTISCNNVVFNLVTLNFGAGTKTISGNCSLPLGNNPTITSTTGAAVTVNGTLTGSGTLTYSNGTLTFNTGSNLTGFDGLSIRALTVAGATVDLSTYSLFNMTSGSSSVILSSGSLALPSNADINGGLSISGGTFNAPSGNMYLAGNLTITNHPATTTFNHNNGTIIFDGSTTSTLSCNGVAFNLVRFDHVVPASKVILAGCNFPLGNNPVFGSSISTAGNFSGSGTLTALNATAGTYSFRINGGATLSGFNGLNIERLELASASNLDLSSYTSVNLGYLNVYGGSTFTSAPLMNVGNIAYISGVFNHNNGTIILTGTDNVILSPQTGTDLTLYNLEKGAGGSVTFPRYSEFSKSVIVQSNITLKGTSGSTLTLQSNLPNSQWNLDVQGTSDVEYLDVKDSNNIGNIIQAAGRNVIDSGNNTGWNFNNPVVTDISITNSTNSNTNDSTPNILFNITDPNVGDTVKYQIQIDNNSDFTSPEIEYTSPLEAQGDKTFTVPSALPDSKYYLRIKGIDSSDGDGGYINFNSGNGFKVDTTGPSGNLFLGYVTDSTNPEVFIISSITDLTGVSEMIYSEKSDFSDATYIPYKQYDTYTLSEGYGNKIVYIKYKDILGNISATFSASISYTQTPQDVDIVVDSDAEVDEGTVGEALNAVAFRILDSKGNPISNILIRLATGMLEQLTDDNGIVVFEDVLLGKQKLLGVYNGVEFEHEVDITDSDKVITIVLDTGNNISPLVVIGLVFGGVVVGGMVTYLLRRKTQQAGS